MPFWPSTCQHTPCTSLDACRARRPQTAAFPDTSYIPCPIAPRAAAWQPSLRQQPVERRIARQREKLAWPVRTREFTGAIGLFAAKCVQQAIAAERWRSGNQERLTKRPPFCEKVESREHQWRTDPERLLHPLSHQEIKLYNAVACSSDAHSVAIPPTTGKAGPARNESAVGTALCTLLLLEQQLWIPAAFFCCPRPFSKCCVNLNV